MTDFGTLIYTDCRPGQGLSGGAGLQFQATSAGVDGDAMAVVQGHLLYEPPSAWMREQRPVEDYPPSFAHAGGDQFATAAGVYLGQEANGTREGNQLTHAVVTRDPRAYGLLRPAQLFGASFWATKPAATTRCDPVPADPPPGILDTESVHDFVRHHPDGPRLLAALLTVLSMPEDGTNPQVLFIADQTEPVLTWIAAATLLVPHRHALQIGFKVFTTTPTRSAQRVLAVHPGWDTPPASVDDPGGYLVVDLLAGRWSEVEPSRTAALWAGMFCAGDPFDVTDAVELAAGCGLPAAEATSLARVAVLQEPPDPEHAETLIRWLTEGPAELVSAYGAPVAAAFTTDVENQPRELLRSLDRATRGGTFDQQAVPVRMAWLAAELRWAAENGRTVHERVEPVTDREWVADHSRRARDMTIRVLRSARAGGFAAVLDVAGRFGVPVRYADIGPAADDFITHWALNPQIPYTPRTWPCGGELEDRLRDHLNEAIQGGTVRPSAIGDRWFRTLPPRDPGAPLDAALIAARVVAADPDERATVVRDMLADAAATPDPGRRLTELSRCLWHRTTPTRAELHLLAGVATAATDIDPAVVDEYLSEQARAGTLAEEDLDLVRVMRTSGVLRPVQRTADWLAYDERLRAICVELPTLCEPDPRYAEKLAGMPLAIVRVHRSALADALLDSAVPGIVAAVLDTTDVTFQRGYAKKATARLKDKPAVHAVATAMVIADRSRDRQTSDDLLAAVNKWANWAGPGPVDKVSTLLDVRGFKSAYARWLDLLDTNKVRRGRSWLRGSKGR